MNQPPIFHEDRPDVMHDLIVSHPFATIVAHATGGLTADHVPLVLKDCQGKSSLQGHIAANNPLFRDTTEAFQVLTIFQGPQTYVTPSWYASKQEHGKVVPTWNYVVVHVHGTLHFNREPDWLLQHLEDLTHQHESHRAEPWAEVFRFRLIVHCKLLQLCLRAKNFSTACQCSSCGQLFNKDWRSNSRRC